MISAASHLQPLNGNNHLSCNQEYEMSQYKIFILYRPVMNILFWRFHVAKFNNS
jgi:hypothetical protein